MAPSSRQTTLYLILLVFGLSLYANASRWVEEPEHFAWFPPFQAGLDVNLNTHLGDEYYRIAVALSEGRGFSDPFGVGTGPTAWMPPLYPALLALPVKLLPDRAALSHLVLFAKNCCLVFAGVVLLRIATRTRRRIDPAWAAGFFTLWLLAHFDWLFQTTHDVWLLLLLVTCNLALAYRIRFESPEHILGLSWYWSWGVAGALTFLASPVGGFMWFAVSTWLLRCDRQLSRGIAIAALVAALCASGWVVRNAVVFDRLVLMKSNAFFDLYLANYVSQDGVYTENIFRRYHPSRQARGSENFLYAEVGEMPYVEGFRRRFLLDLRLDPGSYFRKAGNRLLAATLVYHPYRRYAEGPHPLFPTLVHALPLLGLLAALCFAHGHARSAVLLGAVFYASYLAPYVAVAYYNRYLLPLTPILILFCFWGADTVADVLNQKKRSEPSLAPPASGGRSTPQDATRQGTL